MNPKLIIGTVAGLISLATTAKANIVISPINDQLLTNSINTFDIDGNGSDDFQIEYVNSSITEISGLFTENIIAVDGVPQARIYTLGENIAFSDPTAALADMDNVVGAGTSYLGLKFLIGTQVHAGWLELSYPTTTQEDGVLVSAAYESVSGNDIQVIPEPNTAMLTFFGAMIAWFTKRFRREKLNCA